MESFATERDVRSVIEEVLSETRDVVNNSYRDNVVEEKTVSLTSAGETLSVGTTNLDNGLENNIGITFSYTLPKIQLDEENGRELRELYDSDALNMVKNTIEEFFDPTREIKFTYKGTRGSSCTFEYHFSLKDMTKIPSEEEYEFTKLYSLELHAEWAYVKTAGEGRPSSMTGSAPTGNFYVGESKDEQDIDINFGDEISVFGSKLVVCHNDEAGIHLKNEEGEVVAELTGFDDAEKLAKCSRSMQDE